MADEADLAFESEQHHLSFALQRRRSSVLQPAGICHNCAAADLAPMHLFCDADCASDWEYQDGVRRKLGLPDHRMPMDDLAATPALGS